MNHQSAYCINERPESITLTSLSNLVKLRGTPDVGKVYHKTPTSSKPLSRSQRCFSQFDRKTDCFDSGLENGSLRDFDSSLTLMATKCQATFEAVCLTQTRHGGPVNKNQPDSQNECGIAQSGQSAANARGSRIHSDYMAEVVGSNPAPATIWQKSRRVLRLNYNSGPNMARHEQGTLTVGIQHGQSRRYA